MVLVLISRGGRYQAPTPSRGLEADSGKLHRLTGLCRRHALGGIEPGGDGGGPGGARAFAGCRCAGGRHKGAAVRWVRGWGDLGFNEWGKRGGVCGGGGSRA